MHVYDEFTQEVARELPYPIDRVHLALAYFALWEVPAARAAAWLREIARTGLSLDTALRAAAAGADPPKREIL